MKKYLFLIGILFFCIPLFGQEEWLIDQFNTSFATVGYRHYSTSHFWNKHGDKKPAYNRFHLNEFFLYAQCGITCEDTIGIHGAYDKIQESMNGRTLGWADFEIDWKHLLWKTKTQQLMFQVIAIIPSTTVFQPALRYGRFGGEFDIGYRQIFYLREKRGWYDVIAGYRAYQGFPSDQVRAYFKAGYNPWSCAWMSADIEAALSLEYGVFNGHSHRNQSLIAFAANYRLLRGDIIGVLYILNRVALAAGVYQHIWGNNVGTGGGTYVSASARF